MNLETSIVIDAPPEAVWRVWSDVERWPEWTNSIREVRLLTPGALAVGSRARIRQPKFPPAIWTVTEVEEGRAFIWVSQSFGSRVMGWHRIEAQAAGSLARLGIGFQGPIGLAVGWLTRSLCARYLEMEAAGLKARSMRRSASTDHR